MPNLAKLPLEDDEHRTVEGKAALRCVVEAPAGSAVKFKYDPELKIFTMGPSLIKGLTYPFDWGFFPSTLGEDGDPLDVMLIHDVSTFPGIVVSAQLIGVLEVAQDEKGKKQENDRFFAVPVKSHREDEINDVSDVSERIREELEQFFTVTARLEGKTVHVRGWHGPSHARELLAKGVSKFLEATKDTKRH